MERVEELEPFTGRHVSSCVELEDRLPLAAGDGWLTLRPRTEGEGWADADATAAEDAAAEDTGATAVGF